MFKTTREASKRRDIRSLDEPGNPRTKGMRQSLKSGDCMRLFIFLEWPSSWPSGDCQSVGERQEGWTSV